MVCIGYCEFHLSHIVPWDMRGHNVPWMLESNPNDIYHTFVNLNIFCKHVHNAYIRYCIETFGLDNFLRGMMIYALKLVYFHVYYVYKINIPRTSLRNTSRNSDGILNMSLFDC